MHKAINTIHLHTLTHTAPVVKGVWYSLLDEYKGRTEIICRKNTVGRRFTWDVCSSNWSKTGKIHPCFCSFHFLWKEITNEDTTFGQASKDGSANEIGYKMVLNFDSTYFRIHSSGVCVSLKEFNVNFFNILLTEMCSKTHHFNVRVINLTRLIIFFVF